jgi:hypothetical protein
MPGLKMNNELFQQVGETKLTDLRGDHYVELAVPGPGSSGDGVDALSCLILAAAALALFPRKRFRMSSFKK